MNKKLNLLIAQINKLLSKKPYIVIAIDGRCGSGKTTLASHLQKEFQANLFHMDDFYLPLNLRTPETLSQVAGNIDRRRFIKEVLLPLQERHPFTYRVYSHFPKPHFNNPIQVEPAKVAIIEGSYSCHPDFATFYDYKIFLSLDKEKQWQRLNSRETPEELTNFAKIWIPKEEQYFQACHIRNKCDFYWES